MRLFNLRMVKGVVLQFIRGCFLLMSFLVVSCASINPTSVSDADRDKTGVFDGQWELTQQPLNSIQTVGQERFRCKFNKQTAVLIVSDGIGRINLGKYRAEGNIASNGRFRISMPTDFDFTSRAAGNKGEGSQITYIFQGKLGQSESNGLFTLGKKSLNNSGCSTKLKIASSKSAKKVFIPATTGTKKVVGKWSFVVNDVPGVSSSSSVTNILTIKKEGEHFFGELEVSLTWTPSCGKLSSTTITPISANLIKNRLILTAMENTTSDNATCGEKTYLNAPTYGKFEKITLDYIDSDNDPQLKFLDSCGWRSDGKCVFTKPHLRFNDRKT